MIRLLISLAILFFALSGSANAMNCNAGVDDHLGLHESEATQFQFQFESGATWELCWHIDQHAGLVLSRVFYGAPAQPPVQVFDALSLGQILYKYDQDVEATHLLSESGLGSRHHLLATTADCEGGELIVGINDQGICQRFHQINHMTWVRRSESIKRHEVSLHARSRIGSQYFEQIYRLSEDGEITPSVVYSGRISRYTNDPRFGIKLGDSEQYAASASLLLNWRLDFNIAGTPNNDQVDEIEFIPSGTDAVERSISITPIGTETRRTIHSESFRGWRISDAEYSSGESNGAEATTRVGYYLDPQGAGYRYVSRSHPWSQFDLFVTARRACEKLASGNDHVNATCSGSLDTFTNDEDLSSVDTVLWFSVGRHFTPRLEDYPAISAMEIGFKLVPFDWSAYSPFNPPLEESAAVDLLRGEDQ